jgi:GTP-binding protein
VRSDDELLHMSADGTVTSVANSQRPVLVTDDEDDTDE